jgi:hypothetical protein
MQLSSYHRDGNNSSNCQAGDKAESKVIDAHLI